MIAIAAINGSGEMKKNLYMKVTRDKYELPLIVTEGAQELADHEGVNVNTIYSSICHYEKGDQYSPYRRVRIEEGD